MTMDSDKLSQRIRKRFDHNQAKRVLREKYQAKMLFAYAGGMWHAGPALLNTLSACPDATAVLEDTHGNPVKIDVSLLELAAQQRWQEQMNAWHAELETIKRER